MGAKRAIKSKATANKSAKASAEAQPINATAAAAGSDTETDANAETERIFAENTRRNAASTVITHSPGGTPMIASPPASASTSAYSVAAPASALARRNPLTLVDLQANTGGPWDPLVAEQNRLRQEALDLEIAKDRMHENGKAIADERTVLEDGQASLRTDRAEMQRAALAYEQQAKDSEAVLREQQDANVAENSRLAWENQKLRQAEADYEARMSRLEDRETHVPPSTGTTAAVAPVMAPEAFTALLATLAKVLSPHRAGPTVGSSTGSTQPMLLHTQLADVPTMTSHAAVFSVPADMQGAQGRNPGGSRVAGFTTCLPLAQAQLGGIVVGLTSNNGSPLSWASRETVLSCAYEYLGTSTFRLLMTYEVGTAPLIMTNETNPPLLWMSRAYHAYLTANGHLPASDIPPWFPKEQVVVDLSAPSTVGQASGQTIIVNNVTTDKKVSTHTVTQVTH